MKLKQKLSEWLSLHNLSKQAVFVISVLLAALINGIAIAIISSYYEGHTYTRVVLEMIVITLVYVPLFAFLGSYVEKYSKEYVQKSKTTFSKNRRVGLLIGFLLALLLLFILFALIRHGLNPFKDLWNWLT